MSNDDINPTAPTEVETLPPPPPGHLILLLTRAFQSALQTNDIDELEGANKMYKDSIGTNPEFYFYDRSALSNLQKTAKQRLSSLTAMSTPLPPSPPQRTSSTTLSQLQASQAHHRKLGRTAIQLLLVVDLRTQRI